MLVFSKNAYVAMWLYSSKYQILSFPKRLRIRSPVRSWSGRTFCSLHHCLSGAVAPIVLKKVNSNFLSSQSFHKRLYV